MEKVSTPRHDFFRDGRQAGTAYRRPPRLRTRSSGLRGAASGGEGGWGAPHCRLYGSHEPFDEATLRRLYPTHEAYVAAVREVVRENLAAGYILEHDAEETIRDAERSSIGRW
jgi:hypothetical protein